MPLDAGAAAVRSGLAFEGAAVAFEVRTGSQKAGPAVRTGGRRRAVESPFTARRRAGYGAATDDLVPTRRRLSDGAGGTGADRNRIALAYGQVLSKGRFQAAELRQFTEAGVGVREFAAAAGVSVGRLQALMEQGKVSSDVVVKAFEKMTGAGGRFFGMNDRLSRTVEGRWPGLVETLDILGGKLAVAGFKSLDVAAVPGCGRPSTGSTPPG